MTQDTTGDALVRAAGELLANEGPEALTVRRIAATAGCSTMGLYSRFGGKDGVVERLWVDGFRRLRAAIAAVPITDDPIHDLEQINVAYRDWALANATSYGIMFTRSVPDFVPSAEAKVLSIETFGEVVDAVQRAQARGRFPGADATDVAHVLWALSHGLVSLQLAGMGGFPERNDLRFELANRALLDGLASRP